MNRFLIAFISYVTFGHATAEPLRIATEGAFPPFNIIDENGEVAGLEREIGDEICRRAEFDCTWVKNDWGSIVPNLISSNYDAIMAGVRISPERMDIIAFSDIYFPPDPSIYAAVSDVSCSLSSSIIAVQTNSLQAAYAVEKKLDTLEFNTAPETMAAVKSGEADCVLAPRKFIQSMDDEAFRIVSENIHVGGGVAVGLRKSDTELKGRIDTAIQAMKTDGSLNDLIAEYFDGLRPFP